MTGLCHNQKCINVTLAILKIINFITHNGEPLHPFFADLVKYPHLNRHHMKFTLAQAHNLCRHPCELL